MKKALVSIPLAVFIIGIFFIICSCGDEENNTTEPEKDENRVSVSFEKQDKATDNEPDEETDPNIFKRKENERLIPFVERAWKIYCQYPGANIEFELNGHTHILSYCRTKQENWFKYLLLKDIDGTKTKYTKQAFHLRNQIPSETEEYYAFPSFSPETAEGIDVDKDGTEDIVIGIHVTGKSTGAGAEYEDYWDEYFYEVYRFVSNGIRFSSELTDMYNKSLDESFTAVSVEEKNAILSELQGVYVQGSMKDQLYWMKCSNKTVHVYGNQWGFGISKQDTTDGYDVTVNKIEGDKKINFYSLYCEIPSADNSETTNIQVNCLNVEGVRYMYWKGIEEIYIFSEDKDKVPIDYKDCED